MNPYISFIVPAHNEAFEIGRCLTSILDSARSVEQLFEIIVVNDASTDRTAEIAREAGARVIDVELRKISAVRNVGASQAKGDLFIFVDADTQITEGLLRAVLAAVENGAIGGGAWVRFSPPISIFIQMALPLFNFFYMILMGWAAGCFVFARRSAFEAVKGFDETLFATEEIFLSMALKRQGKFVVLRQSVTTSSRKIRMYSFWQIVPLGLRFLVHGFDIMRQRKGLDWWYEGKREK
jgi:glycosyltransferase involved in cell wall biosynthesis